MGELAARVYARSRRANDIYYTSAMNYGPLSPRRDGTERDAIGALRPRASPLRPVRP